LRVFIGSNVRSTKLVIDLVIGLVIFDEYFS